MFSCRRNHGNFLVIIVQWCCLCFCFSVGVCGRVSHVSLPRRRAREHVFTKRYYCERVPYPSTASSALLVLDLSKQFTIDTGLQISRRLILTSSRYELIITTIVPRDDHRCQASKELQLSLSLPRSFDQICYRSSLTKFCDRLETSKNDSNISNGRLHLHVSKKKISPRFSTSKSNFLQSTRTIFTLIPLRSQHRINASIRKRLLRFAFPASQTIPAK